MAKKTSGEGFTFKDGSKPGVCKVCGEPSWSARSNRCAEHKVTPTVKLKVEKTAKTSSGAPTRSDGAPIEDEKGKVAQAVESAGAITRTTFSAKPPTAAEWEDKLTSLTVLLSMTYVEYVVVRPFHLDDNAAAYWVDRLGMTDEEASSIVEPCSFLLARTEINKKHGREAIEVLAFAPAILSIVAWADRVSEFRREMQRQLGGDNVVSFESASNAQGPSRTESGAPIANFGGVTDPREAPTARVDRGGSDVDHAN